MSDARKFINYLEVVARVGAAAFKDEFVTNLTWRERWILEETGLFGTPETFLNPAKDPKGPFASLPELPAARAKLAYFDWQRNRISDWLVTHGVQSFARNGYVEVDKAQFEAAFAHAFPKAALGNSAALFPEDRLTPRLGRPPKWDWPGAMAAYAAHLAKDADGLPKKQADAERWVQNWFVQKSDDGDAPPITEIRTRVAVPIYKASRKVGNSKK